MTKFAVLAALLSLPLLTVPSFAQEGERPAAGQRQASPLKEEMEKLEEALEAVEAFLAKPEGDAPLAVVTEAQAEMLKAKARQPRLTERQPEADKPKFVNDYKVQMNKLVRGLLDLEDALLEKNWKAAKKVLDSLEELKKAGHDKFKGKRQRRGGGDGEGGGAGGRNGGGERGGEKGTGGGKGDK